MNLDIVLSYEFLSYYDIVDFHIKFKSTNIIQIFYSTCNRYRMSAFW